MKKVLIFILFAGVTAQLSAQEVERDCSEIAIFEKKVDGLTACELESVIERKVQELSGVKILSISKYYGIGRYYAFLRFTASYKSETVNFDCQLHIHNKYGFAFSRRVGDRDYFLSILSCKNERFEIREDLLKDLKFSSDNQYVHELADKTIIQ